MIRLFRLPRLLSFKKKTLPYSQEGGSDDGDEDDDKDSEIGEGIRP
jgi:hypothetical protein